MCNAVSLLLEISQKGSLLARRSYSVYHRTEILQKNRTQIADKAVCHVVVWLMASAQDKVFAVENSALLVQVKVVANAVFATKIVYALQAVFAYRDKLALIVCCAR